MVTQAIPSQQMVTGSEIANLGALLAQMAAQTNLAYQDQAGYYNPSLFGSMSGFQPTLARDQLNLSRELGQGNLQLDRELGFGNLALGRDQLNAAIAEAQRQYQLDLQRFGLDVANFNYNQRLGDATVRLEQLGLLSSLRGPSDYLAHNYVLNNMAAPPGQQVDPFQMTAGLNQQYTAPPMQDVPQPPPTTQYDAQMRAGIGANTGAGGGTGTGARPPTGPTQAVQPAQQQQAAPRTIAITGNQQADAALKASPEWSGAPDPIKAEFDRISQVMQDTYGRAIAQNPNFQLYAGGGTSPGGMALVGDSKSGKPTGHEELVVSEGPFTVLPHDVIKGSELMGAPRAAYGVPPGFYPPTTGTHFPANGPMQPWIDWYKTMAPGMTRESPGFNSWWGQRPSSGYPPYNNTGGQPHNPSSTPTIQPVPPMPQNQMGGPFMDWYRSMPAQGATGWDTWWGGRPSGFGPQAGANMPQGYVDDWNKRMLSRFQGTAEDSAPTYLTAQQEIAQQDQQASQSPRFGGQNGYRSPMSPGPTPGMGGPPGVWRAATGGSFTGANGTGDGQGFFNFNTYTPQDTANAPFVQQTLGNMPSPAFQQRGQPLGPFGAQPFSYTNYLGLLPSAREMLKGYVETPTPMGGLGSDWMDELERSRRAAATGVSFGPAGYARV